MNISTYWKRRRAERRAKRRAKTQSDEIDRQLEEELKHRKQKHNILLISAPGSEAEAFAIVKYMEMDHDEYTLEGLAEYRPVVWKILLENSRSIARALRRRNLKRANRAAEANCKYIMNHRSDTDNPEFLFLPGFAQVVQDLWTEEVIPVLLDRPSAIPLADNAEYFFAEAQRITTEDYVPSIEDIGHTSERGVMETRFNVEQLSIRITQVYGQPGYFRKWIPLFEDVTSVMFCARLSDYDEPGMSRGSRRTRLVDSLLLFEAVVNSPWFSRTSVILFLTGMDEFRAKLPEVPLNEYFPEYTGGTDADEGARCILHRFRELNYFPLRVYPHIAEVSDMPGIRLLTTAVRESVLQNELRELDLL